jgi:hypothetical protein
MHLGMSPWYPRDFRTEAGRRGANLIDRPSLLRSTNAVGRRLSVELP